MTFTRFFHLISYIQYPLVAIGIYFAFTPYIQGLDHMAKNLDLFFASINKTLLFFGLGVSFSTFQDTTKTQNKLSKKVWESPQKGKAFIIFLCISISLLFFMAIYGYFITSNSKIKEISLGTFVLGIGMMGLLKSGVEMFENHRKDKNPDNSGNLK
ncbi:hypothetical protein BKI52_45275 [marine bacterium AO1-C]|nr:hypothetical protein BKI52_45275 [marine bacterium AO1-C]